MSEKTYNTDTLLAIHKILLCAGECPPIEYSDSWEVKALKGIIHIWHVESAELKKKEAALSEKDKELKSWRDSRDGVMSHVEEMQAEITRLKGLLAEAVAALETILFLSDAPSCHAVARTILGLEKIGESHEKG
jgi:hypothetical protein